MVLTGGAPIANRTQQLIDAAGREIVLIIGQNEVLTDELIEQLQAAQESDLDVLIGTVDDQLRDRIQDALPDAEVFVSGLEWLNGSSTDHSDPITISRLLLIDHNTILVSSVQENPAGEADTEKAVFGRGFDNGIVVIARRLMATGLPPAADADTNDETTEIE